MTTSSLSLGGLTNDIDTDLDDVDLSGATEFAGPSDSWMASLPDVATVRLATTVQPPPTPSPAVLVDQQPSTMLPPDPSAHDTTARPMTASAQQPMKSFNSTATQVEPSTTDAATAASPLPPPLLSAPSISTMELARRVEQSFHSHPLAPTDAIINDVRLSFIDSTPASETGAAGLTIDFGAELLRLSADRLLRELQARFADLPHVDQHMTATMLRYILEQLDIWRRRPERPSSSVPYNLL